MKNKSDTAKTHNIKVKKLKPKQKKKQFYAARNTITNCPNCLSTMKLDRLGLWECSGDKLKIWEPDFVRYKSMDEQEKLKFLSNLSNSGRFLELYDRWLFAYNSDSAEPFNCGYTNVLFPLTGTAQITIPDPLYTKILEQKLGRPLTEEEIHGESELYSYKNKVLTEWKKGAKLIRIPFIILPNEDTFYEKLED